MRKAILILSLLALLVANLAGQLPKRRKSTRRADPNKKTESPCGVSQSRIEFLDEIRVEWRVASETKKATNYYNTVKTVCWNKILKVLIKSIPKNVKSFS